MVISFSEVLGRSIYNIIAKHKCSIKDYYFMNLHFILIFNDIIFDFRFVMGKCPIPENSICFYYSSTSKHLLPVPMYREVTF